MIGDKNANARGNALKTPDVNPHADGLDKKHHAFHTCPINRIRIARD